MANPQTAFTPWMGVKTLTALFDQYQQSLDTYTEAQREAIAGLDTSTTAIDHYISAYELWLDGSKQLLRTLSTSEDDDWQTELASTPLTNQHAGEHNGSARRSSNTMSVDPSESDPVLEERVAMIERRQQALEATLNEIHTEVVETDTI